MCWTKGWAYHLGSKQTPYPLITFNILSSAYRKCPDTGYQLQWNKVPKKVVLTCSSNTQENHTVMQVKIKSLDVPFHEWIFFFLLIIQPVSHNKINNCIKEVCWPSLLRCSKFYPAEGNLVNQIRNCLEPTW